VHRLGERHAAMGGLVCGVAGFLLFALASSGSLFLVGIAFLALMGIANPAFQALMSRRVDPMEQGQLQGALGSIRAVTGMLGPIMFTQIFAASVKQSSEHLLGAAFLVSAGLLVTALLIGAKVLPRGNTRH